MTPLIAVRAAPDPQHGGSGPVLLLLHGYGSHENDLVGLIPALDLPLPWASLRGPVGLANGGAAWFTITTPGDPAAEVVAEATDAVWSWVDANLPPEAPVVPLGFSQGGLMASQLLRTRPERVLAPVVLAGFVQRAAQRGDARLADERPALFWGRGAADHVIGAEAVARTAEFLPVHTDLHERIYPSLAHSVSREELKDVRDFLLAALSLDVDRFPTP